MFGFAVLDLTDTLRSYFHRSGTLLYDADGQEVFAGLTRAESEFFIECSQTSELSTAERRLCVQVKKLHLAARLRNLKIPSQFGWYPGNG